VERESENLRAALDGCLLSDPSPDAAATTEEVELGLALGTALGSFWITRCHFAEGRRYLMALLARSEAIVSPAHARALTIAGRLAQLQEGGSATSYRLLEEGLAMARAVEDRPLVACALLFIVDQAPAHLTQQQRQALCEEALALYRELGDRRGTAVALVTLGLTCFAEDARRARALFEEGSVALREWGSSTSLAWACFHLGRAQYFVGEYEQAAEVGRECLPHFEQFDELVGLAACHDLQARIALAQDDLPNARRHAQLASDFELRIGRQSGQAKPSTACLRLGQIALAEGDVAAAEALYQEALAIARAMHTRLQQVEAMTGLGRAALRRGDPRAAAERFVEVLSMIRNGQPGPGALQCLEGLARAFTLETGSIGDTGPQATSAAPSHLLCAARLAGAAEAVRERKGIGRPPREQSEQEGWIATLRASLGDAAFTAACEAGRALSWQETMRVALGEAGGTGR
jgi:tetratricopeptide (TPR) repeat protein